MQPTPGYHFDYNLYRIDDPTRAARPKTVGAKIPRLSLQFRKHKNRFLLTGSSSLDLINNVSESLAGRVGLVELGTFKANETYAFGLPDFYKIFNKDLNHTTVEFLKGLEPEISHDRLMQAFLKGGYPEPVLERDDRFYDAWMESYIQTYIQRDIRTLFPRLDLVKYQRFVSI